MKQQTRRPADERPPKRTRIQERNREKILDAAEAAIADYGFDGATVDRIAERAGMSKPNLLYYFKTKDDVYQAALRRVLDLWLDALARLDPSGDPAAELSAYVADACELSRRRPHASRLFAREILAAGPRLSGGLREELQTLISEKSRAIQAWMDQGKLRGREPSHLLFLIWTAAHCAGEFDVDAWAQAGERRSKAARVQSLEASIRETILQGVLPEPRRGASSDSID